jgi:transcriptional regulator CtsR
MELVNTDKVTSEMLERIFFKSVQYLERLLDENKVTSQDMKTILKLMVDMGMEVDKSTGNDLINNLIKNLPVDIDEAEFKDYIYS